MKFPSLAVSRFTLAAVVLAMAAPASAVLRDHGPGDPTLIFPQWYRDLNNAALGLCLSTTPSPNPPAGLKPMCFPLGTDPAGFPGNVGPEIFYNNLTVTVGKGTGGFTLKYLAALEASYIPAGLPIHGTESVFARIRVVASVVVPGTYTVTHPFGVEVFPNVQPGPRGIFFTADVPFGTPNNFDTALTGRIGPWIEWDFINPGETLTLSTGEQFLGDPNYAHTFKGSPFGINYVRVDGPLGSNLDGLGNDFLITTVGNVVGQRWLAPIATRTTIDRAVYSRDPVKGLNTVDVWVSSAPAQKLVLTGDGMPSMTMTGDASGQYFSHVEYPATKAGLPVFPPAAVSVTNLTSVPVISATAGLVDAVNVTGAVYDTLAGAIRVTATSSDLSVPPPALAVLGPLGGPMVAGSYTVPLPAGTLPPRRINVASTGGGVDSDDLVVLPGVPMNPAFPPVAVPDAFTVAGAGPTTFDVSTNDVVTPPAGVGSVLILTQPAQGAAVAAVTGGLVTYTPTPGASGIDTFTYVLVDTAGAVSNAATVSLTVPFVAPAPAANADNFAMVQNTSRTYAVLANDVAGTGTTINPASVAITTPPAHGTARANLDGTVTYTPALNFNSAIDTFAYTVANNFGTVSAPATVTVVVFGGPESVSIGKALYTVSKAKWNIVGSTNWFNAVLTQTTASCYLISSGGVAIAPQLIGTTLVDTTGKFAVVPVGGTPTPVSPAIVNCKTSNGGTSPGATVGFQ